MAQIIGAIATSHTPTIGFAFDAKKQEDPVWKPIFEAYEPIKAWLKEKRPGALSATVKCVHQSYYLPSMTAIATAIYESDAAPMPAHVAEAARARAGEQVRGIEALEGTYLFDLDRSVKNYRLNRFLHDLVVPEHRAAFMSDPEAAFERASLTTEERDMIRRRDWRALIRYGAIFFVLEKLAAVVGVSNLHVYAAMRGQTLDEFQKTRNAQVLYSVGGNEVQKKIEAAAN